MNKKGAMTRLKQRKTRKGYYIPRDRKRSKKRKSKSAKKKTRRKTRALLQGGAIPCVRCNWRSWRIAHRPGYEDDLI